MLNLIKKFLETILKIRDINIVHFFILFMYVLFLCIIIIYIIEDYTSYFYLNKLNSEFQIIEKFLEIKHDDNKAIDVKNNILDKITEINKKEFILTTILNYTINYILKIRNFWLTDLILLNIGWILLFIFSFIQEKDINLAYFIKGLLLLFIVYLILMLISHFIFYYMFNSFYTKHYYWSIFLYYISTYIIINSIDLFFYGLLKQ